MALSPFNDNTTSLKVISLNTISVSENNMDVTPKLMLMLISDIGMLVAKTIADAKPQEINFFIPGSDSVIEAAESSGYNTLE